MTVGNTLFSHGAKSCTITGVFVRGTTTILSLQTGNHQANKAVQASAAKEKRNRWV